MAGKHKKPKPNVPTRPFLTHGGKTIQIPMFSGPVGPDVPDLRQKFPTLNTARDVETVQYYLSELIDIHYLKVPGTLPWLDKCQVNPTVDAGLIEAIKQFQTKVKVGDTQETSRQLIKPDGETLKALVDYGDYGAKLEELKLRTKDPADYIFYGSFDMEKLVRLYKAAFSSKPNYTEATEPNLRQLIGFMTNDPNIVDIRWMAYILATVCREATAPMAETHKNAKGKTVTQHPWRMTWSPVEESGHGSGRSYEKPVKVFVMADGNLRVTEWDGDQWTVKPDGSNKAITAGAKAGTSPSMAAPVKTYTDDPGTENAYFGRGYVQLTWWFNYATAGIHISKGTSLLTDPSQALDPDTSYKLMSHCLRTGFGFANGHKLGDFMYGGLTNYKGARAMVNGTDHADEIAANAKEFERILMEARN